MEGHLQAQIITLWHRFSHLSAQLLFGFRCGTALTSGFMGERSTENMEPLLINIHGSGFVMGSAAMDDPFMTQFVEKCNVKVTNIDYPLSPDVMFPTALNQCHARIRYAKTHGRELGIDSDRIMLMGHSAGGNLCAAIGIIENSDPKVNVRGIILDYPPTDVRAMKVYIKNHLKPGR